MLKSNIYGWIKQVNSRGSNPNFDDIMMRYVDDYEVEDIENALQELEEDGKISKGDLCGILYYEAW